MTYETELDEPTTLPPDDAFALLGNETRVRILQTLGEAGEPLAFSELFERVEYDTTANFSYHLEKLAGHFVRKTADGYALRQSGRRVVTAVLAGTVTDAPVEERTRLDHECPYCGAPIEVRYHQGHLEQFCTGCDGTFATDGSTRGGYLGCLLLPPAGLRGRPTADAYRAGWIWTQLHLSAIGAGICPYCSASIDREATVCDAHDAADGRCTACDRRHAVQLRYECTNCIFDGKGTIAVRLGATAELLAFLTAHDLNPFAPTRLSRLRRCLGDYDETVRSVEPFEATFTFTVDGDALALTVDDDLSVIDATIRRASEPV